MAITTVGGDKKGAADEPVARLAEQLEALEIALKGLHACGRALGSAPRSVFDLRPAARAAERAIAALLDAYDGRRETVAALTDSISAADELGQELGRAVAVDPGLEPAIEWAKASSDWLRKALGSPSAGRLPIPRPLFASMSLPSLHAPARATLAPSFSVVGPVPPPPAAPEPVDSSLPPAERLAVVKARAEARRKAAEERRLARADAARAPKRKELAEVPPGFVAGSHHALSPEQAIVAKARECFEDVAGLGLMRVPLLGDDWRTMATLDQRMLAAVDAIVALGPVALAAVEPLVTDAPAKDPTRGFAAALILGSVEGRDSLAGIDRALSALDPAEPETARAFSEALALVPHPDLPAMLRSWLADSSSGLRALAIDVLARRQLATKVELAKALMDEAPEVIAKALVPAALVRVPELASRAEELLQHTHEDILSELPWALVLGDVPFAVSRLRDWLNGPKEERALLPLALAGEQDDVEEIVSLLTKKPTRARVHAAGFGGLASAVPALVDLLAHAKDDELKLAAAFALHRLTDAPLFDDTTIAPEKIDVPEPDEPDDPAPRRSSLAHRVSDPRDLPSDGSGDRALLPSVDAGRWRTWLAERGEPFAPQLRLRRGKAYTPALSLLEIANAPIVPFERRVLYRELVIKTGDAHPFDPHAFVPTQQAQLDKWAGAAERGSSQPGAWGRARRRG